MLIEFDLPREREDFLYVRRQIIYALERWAFEHNLNFQQKTAKYTHRVCFDDDAYYSFFAMSWQPPPHIKNYSNYRIVVNRNN